MILHLFSFCLYSPSALSSYPFFQKSKEWRDGKAFFELFQTGKNIASALPSFPKAGFESFFPKIKGGARRRKTYSGLLRTNEGPLQETFPTTIDSALVVD